MARLTRRTFAIDPAVGEKIDALTDGRTLEANLLINKALRRYLEWGRFVDAFKPVTFDPRLLKLFWSHVTVEEARERGIQNGTGAVVEFILYYFRKFDLESLEALPGNRSRILQRLRLLRVQRPPQPHNYSETRDGTERIRLLWRFSQSAVWSSRNRVELEESDDQLGCKILIVNTEKSVVPAPSTKG